MNFTHLATQLLSDDPQSRLTGLATLQAESDDTVLPPDVRRGLLQCLGHNRKHVQRSAAEQLVRFSRRQPEIISALTHKLTEADPRTRWTAAFTLSHIDLPEPLPLPVLIENLGHEESDLRWAAATAVLRLAVQHPSVIEELLRLARAGNAIQRRMALYCLRDLGQVNREAQKVYLVTLCDTDPMVRLAGLSCLGKRQFSNPETRTALLRLLDTDPDLGVRRATAVTLGQLGDADPLVAEALTAAASSNDTGLSKAASGALKRLKGKM